MVCARTRSPRRNGRTRASLGAAVLRVALPVATRALGNGRVGRGTELALRTIDGSIRRMFTNRQPRSLDLRRPQRRPAHRIARHAGSTAVLTEAASVTVTTGRAEIRPGVTSLSFAR